MFIKCKNINQDDVIHFNVILTVFISSNSSIQLFFFFDELHKINILR